MTITAIFVSFFYQRNITRMICIWITSCTGIVHLFLKNILYYDCSSCNLLALWIFFSFSMHAIPPSPSLSDLSASFNEPMSLPALWEDLRKLLIFCTILVFSMLLKPLMFGILLFHLFFFSRGVWRYCVFSGGSLYLWGPGNCYCSGKTIILLQAVLISQEVLRHCLRW